MDYMEPYAKENNLLQLSLFHFGKRRPVPEKTVSEWADGRGNYKLTCVCQYGVPGSFEQDVYAACMRIWVKNGMPATSIKLNYSDIARELNLTPIKAWVGKIKKSLRKLAQARYEFVQCFIKADDAGNKKVSTHFSLFDSASLFEHERGKSKRISESELIFPDIIKGNLEAKYYQLLDMVWYRALPEGLARRLYEYLAKRHYHNVDGKFTISEEALCRWLPIVDKNVTNRRKRLKKISNSLIDKGFLSSYVFDKKKKLCIFEYARNPTPKVHDIVSSSAKDSAKDCIVTAEEQAVFVDFLDWINNIPYFHKSKKRDIASLPISKVIDLYPRIRGSYEELVEKNEKPKAVWIHKEFMKHAKKKEVQIKKIAPVDNSQLSLFQDEPEPVELDYDFEQSKVVVDQDKIDTDLDALFAKMKIKKCSNALKKAVRKYYDSHGFEYVKWNILYANNYAKKNYSPYLQKAFAENWGEEWAEQEKARLEIAEKREKEIVEKIELKQQEDDDLTKLKEEFLVKIGRLRKTTKRKLWLEAEEEIPKNSIGRGMNVKIAYSKKLLNYVNSKNANFPEKVVKELSFIKEIAFEE